jgi:hypothetical protein
LLEEYEANCIENEKFDEAMNATKRIEELREQAIY